MRGERGGKKRLGRQRRLAGKHDVDMADADPDSEVLKCAAHCLSTSAY